MKKTDGRRYNRKTNRDLNEELNVWCAIPERFQKYFKKMPGGSWLIHIPELYFISDTFKTLRAAVIDFVNLNNDFENSEELKRFSAIVNKYK